jgi:hypothetical protein
MDSSGSPPRVRRDAPYLVVVSAVRLLPASRQEWGRAMHAELTVSARPAPGGSSRPAAPASP